MIVLLLGIVGTTEAEAYDVNGVIDTFVGNNIGMHFCPGYLSALSGVSDPVGAIKDGFRQWNAGSGFRMRGANWTWTQESDRTVCALGNGKNEVYSKAQGWFDSHGWSSAKARAQYAGVGGNDIIFNSSWTWTDQPVQDITNSDIPLPHIAMHELGHLIGFNHEYGKASIMQDKRWDMAKGKLRVREDDYVGLADIKSDNSSGVNLMLSRWVTTSPGGDPPPSQTEDRWGDDNYAAGAYSLQNVGDQLPFGVNVVVHGTGSHEVTVAWVVSEEKDCFNHDHIYVGTRTTTVAANTEYVVEPESPYPNQYNLYYVPPGTYWMCAKVDPWGYVSETYEADNGVVTSHTIEVTP